MVSNNIRVCCRFRPVNKREQQEETKNTKLKGANLFTFSPDGRSVEGVNVEKGNRKEAFKLDKIFDNEEGASQGKVYEYVAAETIEDVLKGYNGTIFAYGQTGAGKTHTMFGPDIASDHKGIIPRACCHIFEHILKDTTDTEWEVQCSFLEIYKEVVQDLLVVGDQLKVRQTGQRGVWIEGLSQHYVTCVEEVFSFLAVGEKNRTVTSTGMNETSSRSHSLFILTVTQKLADGTKRTGRLNLADLAGSESIGKTGATGNTLEEAKKINQSLSALGNCINALTKKGHVPYRDSKLTFILSDSLGGNSKTTLVVCCSQHAFNVTETLGTLRFAQRAKEVKNKAVVNAQRSLEQLEAMVAKITERIRLLEAQIQEREKILKTKKGDDFDLSAWRQTFFSDASSSSPSPSSSSSSSSSSPSPSSSSSSSIPSGFSFDDEEEEGEGEEEEMEMGVEAEVALENLEKEKEIVEEEREALERGVEREKFFREGLEEGIVIEREEIQDIISETQQLADERNKILVELSHTKEQVREWEEKSREREEEREKQQQLLREAKNIVLQLQEQREKKKEGREQRENKEEESSLLFAELQKIETQASEVAEELKIAEEQSPLLEKEMKDLTKERKITQQRLTEMTGWDKENLEKQALLIQKQTQLELSQDRLSSFSQGEIEENAQITANFRRRCKDLELQIEQLQRSYDSASSGLELQAEQFKEQMEERIQQKRNKNEEETSSHSSQLAQIEGEMKEVRERGEEAQKETEMIQKEAEESRNDLQTIKEANDAIRALIKEEDAESLERIEQREKLREELLHIRSGFSSRARQNEELLGKISGLKTALSSEESGIEQLERTISELVTQEINKENEISQQKENFGTMEMEFEKSVEALRKAEEEIEAEERKAKELEGEYDRLQAESKELLKTLEGQSQANQGMDEQLQEQRKKMIVQPMVVAPPPQQQQQPPPQFNRQETIRARKRDAFKKSFMPETAKLSDLRNPTFKGWLKKEGGIIKNWKKRYFLLCDAYLYYFKSESGKEVSLGRIELAECEIAAADGDTNRLNSIRIFHPTRRTYFLQADSSEDCLVWVDMLQNCFDSGEPELDTC